MNQLTEKEVSVLLTVFKRLQANEVMTCQLGAYRVMFDKRAVKP